MTPIKKRTAAVAGASLALLLALTGCSAATPSGMPGMDHGGMSSPSVSVQGEVSPADLMFTMMMIPHHAQAIEMSDLVLVKESIDPAVRELAQQIKDAQAPEIELMESWLEEWGMPSSGGMDADDMGGMDHGDGMMSQEDMDALAAAQGDEASRLYLEQMIVHHEGAIDMAEDVIDNGSDPDVRSLAESIITSQTEEIATMRELLDRL
jgi:uncharacterized protein (DUF305 family)